MKRNTISTLHEKIILLEINGNTSPSTTSQRFNDIVKTRAFIGPINGQEVDIFEVIIPKLNVLRSRSFNGIRWNNIEYECVSAFREYDSVYLRGNIKRIRN